MAPSIPLMIEILKEHLSEKVELSIAVNKLSAYFNAAFSIGAFIGPLVFTFIYKYLKWRYSTDLFALFTALYFLLFAGVFYKMIKLTHTLESKSLLSETSDEEKSHLKLDVE